MKKYYKTVIFSNSILKTSFRFGDRFQILPIIGKYAPRNPCALHFPLFLEYIIDYSEIVPNNFIDELSIRLNTENEIIDILSCMTNHHFFRYDRSKIGWGVIVPNETEDMTVDEVKAMNRQQSQFFIGQYQYHGISEDLRISCLTDFNPKMILKECTTYKYFTIDPIDNYQNEVSFPKTLIAAIESYYNLPAKKREKVRCCMCLACDGMDISALKLNLSFLSYIAAIEGLIGLDVADDEIQYKCKSCKSIISSPYKCPQCVEPIWGINQKFIYFLSKYVCNDEKSKKKYKDIYNMRSRITHTSKLFILATMNFPLIEATSSADMKTN